MMSICRRFRTDRHQPQLLPLALLLFGLHLFIGHHAYSHGNLHGFMSLPWLWIIAFPASWSFVASVRHFSVLGLPKKMSRAIPNALRKPKFRPPLTDCAPPRSCPAGRVSGAGVGRGVYVPGGTTPLGLAGIIRETTVDGRPAGRPLGIIYSSVYRIGDPPPTSWPSSFCQTFFFLSKQPARRDL